MRIRARIGFWSASTVLLFAACTFSMTDAHAQKTTRAGSSPLALAAPPLLKFRIHQKDRLYPASIIRTGYLAVDPANFPLAAKHSGAAERVELMLFNDTKVMVENIVIDQKENGMVTWEGSIPARKYGHASLVFINGSMGGTVQIDSKVFEISPTLQSGVAEIVEMDQSKFPDPANHVDASPAQTVRQTRLLSTPLRPQLRTQIRRLPTLSIIKILAIYPVPNIAPTIRPVLCTPYILDVNAAKLEASLNNAMPPSFSPMATQYNNPRMHVRFEVTARCQTGIDLDHTLYQQRQNLRNSETIKALRDTYHADLVALISPRHLQSGCGSSDDAPGQGLDESLAFAVVDQGCALSVFSFAHEIGHLLGMHHERYTAYTKDNSEFPETCSYGYVNVLDGFTTILGGWKLCADLRFGASNACPKVGIYSRGFSNLREGVACSSPAKNGMVGRADNLGQLLIAAPVVSGYR